MKKAIIILLCLALPVISNAQPFSVRKAFHKYGHEDGVTKITIPGIAFDFASLFVDDRETAKMLRGVNKIKILAAEGDEGFDGPNIGKEVIERFKSNQFEPMLTVRNADEDVSILIKEGRKNRKELLVISGDKSDSAIIYIKGKIHPDMLRDLGKEMKIESLKNI
jgi:hypothetical protein